MSFHKKTVGMPAVIGIIVLIAAVLLIAINTGDVEVGSILSTKMTKKEQVSVVDTTTEPISKPPVSSNVSSGTLTYSTSHASISYPSNKFAIASVQKASLPPRYNVNYNGVKLIDAGRLSLLGQQRCYYGASGILSVCNADSEAGITMYEVENSVRSLLIGVDESLIETVVSGNYTAEKYSIGAEGDGTDIYYIALSDGRTLIIERRYINAGFSNEFPRQSDFDAVMDTLQVN